MRSTPSSTRSAAPHPRPTAPALTASSRPAASRSAGSRSPASCCVTGPARRPQRSPRSSSPTACRRSNNGPAAAATRSVSNSKESVVNLMSDVTSISSVPDRRWVILGVIGLAQVMVIMSLTVMNIALLSAQRALHFSTADRQWVVTAYTLAFGSLLLFGGRLADLLGRKVTFLTGLVGFAGVSAIGGASVNFAMLIAARACQGAFAALLVPSALSILTTTFTEPKDRSRAFAVYGAIA